MKMTKLRDMFTDGVIQRGWDIRSGEGVIGIEAYIKVLKVLRYDMETDEYFGVNYREDDAHMFRNVSPIFIIVSEAIEDKRIQMTELWRHYRNWHTKQIDIQPQNPEIHRIYYGTYPQFPQVKPPLRIGRDLGIGRLREVDGVFRALYIPLVFSPEE